MPGRLGKAGVVVSTVVLVGAAAAVVAWERWQGPVVLSLSAGHGLHLGDLAAVPLVVLAIGLWRRRAPAGATPADGWAGPAAAVVLGLPLLVAGVAGTAGGGPLVPAGGGTIDGTIDLASDTAPVPVGRWSDVAVTYDGATIRLYVNGDEVASRAQAGTIQKSPDPLWIGGNRPYGEHFDGVVDEVRVYDRALRADEIRRDMDERVAPARDLVAGYRFDASPGSSAADASGKGNTGTISGAAWTRGRYGTALRFDGVRSVVRIPPSASLDLTRTMTLSAWIRPAAPQDGWRTIVQRQTDAYLLTAGSDHQVSLGRADDIRAALIVAALAWFSFLLATGRLPASPRRRRWWWLPAALFVAGSVADAALSPDPSMVGPALVALWLAATAARRGEAAAFALTALVLAVLTIGSLGQGGPALARSTDEGPVARSVALGVLFVLAGALGPILGYAKHRASVRRRVIR